MVLPTRNRLMSLRRAIASVRAQTWSDWELVVVDDASDDGTPVLLSELASESGRIRSLRHDRRLGGAVARNTGIEHATAPMVAFLDDDAEWRPDKLTRQMGCAALSGDGPTLVYGPVLAVDAGGIHRILGDRVDVRAPFESLASGNKIDTSGVLVSREALLAVDGFDPHLPRLQDWDLWLRLAPRVGFTFHDDIFARTFRVGRRISDDSSALRQAAERMAVRYSNSATLLETLGHMLVAEGETDEGRRLLTRACSVSPRATLRFRRDLAVLAPSLYRLLATVSSWVRERGGRVEDPWPDGADV